MSIQQIALIVLGVAALFFLVVGGVFGLGVYLGWFRIGRGATVKDDFTFTMDADRIQERKKRVLAATQDSGCQAQDEWAVSADKIEAEETAKIHTKPQVDALRANDLTQAAAPMPPPRT
jgi:hypothetical protein